MGLTRLSGNAHSSNSNKIIKKWLGSCFSSHCRFFCRAALCFTIENCAVVSQTCIGARKPCLCGNVDLALFKPLQSENSAFQIKIP